MPKSPRHPVNLKLSTQEFAALAEDADRYGTAPTTMALCYVLAGMQRLRDVVPDAIVPAGQATIALKAAADALREAGKTSEAAAAESAGQELSEAHDRIVDGCSWIVVPGWRLDAYRHRIAWGAQSPGRPDLSESILTSR
jgi:hypothetical protein